MSVFSAAAGVLFSDPNLAQDAWYRDGSGHFTSIRVMLRRPDENVGFGAGRMMSDTTLADVLVSAVPEPLSGEQVIIGDETFLIQGEPKRDRNRMVWRIELVPE